MSFCPATRLSRVHASQAGCHLLLSLLSACDGRTWPPGLPGQLFSLIQVHNYQIPNTGPQIPYARLRGPNTKYTLCLWRTYMTPKSTLSAVTPPLVKLQPLWLDWRCKLDLTWLNRSMNASPYVTIQEFQEAWWGFQMYPEKMWHVLTWQELSRYCPQDLSFQRRWFEKLFLGAFRHPSSPTVVPASWQSWPRLCLVITPSPF